MYIAFSLRKGGNMEIYSICIMLETNDNGTHGVEGDEVNRDKSERKLLFSYLFLLKDF